MKAIASSVERLLRYANCSGSSEAGSTEQMCSLTIFSKHLLKMGVRATGLMFTRLKDRVTSATESESGLTSSAAAVGALSVWAVVSASKRA